MKDVPAWVARTCEVNAQIEWDAMAPSTKVAVRLTWSAKFKDESDDIVDFEQTKLPLQEGS